MKPSAALIALLLCAASLVTHAASEPTLKGEVLEARNVESYTYLRLKTAQGEVWVAVPTSAAQKGAQVTIGNPVTMHNFESKSLKRRFDSIVFGQIVDSGANTSAAPKGATPAAAFDPALKVAKATGRDAKTVAEVVRGKAALKDKTVLVRGQVVKVSLGILGKNWVHLRDGSGSAADGSNDIIVITMDSAAVGNVLQARGTVRTDVNLGAGYSYEVLVDDAALRK